MRSYAQLATALRTTRNGGSGTNRGTEQLVLIYSRIAGKSRSGYTGTIPA